MVIHVVQEILTAIRLMLHGNEILHFEEDERILDQFTGLLIRYKINKLTCYLWIGESSEDTFLMIN